MFAEFTKGNGDSVLVNMDKVIQIKPDPEGGCNLMLEGSSCSYYVRESYGYIKLKLSPRLFLT